MLYIRQIRCFYRNLKSFGRNIVAMRNTNNDFLFDSYVKQKAFDFNTRIGYVKKTYLLLHCSHYYALTKACLTNILNFDISEGTCSYKNLTSGASLFISLLFAWLHLRYHQTICTQPEAIDCTDRYTITKKSRSSGPNI